VDTRSGAAYFRSAKASVLRRSLEEAPAHITFYVLSASEFHGHDKPPAHPLAAEVEMQATNANPSSFSSPALAGMNPGVLSPDKNSSTAASQVQTYSAPSPPALWRCPPNNWAEMPF